MAVWDSPGADARVAAVSTDRELNGVDGVARLDLLEEPLGVIGERSRLVEIHVDRLEEAGARLRSCHVSTSQKNLRTSNPSARKRTCDRSSSGRRGLAVTEPRRYRRRRWIGIGALI